MPACKVRWLVMATGERLPVLVSSADGIPMFLPVVWLVSMRRATHRAANTLHANLQALKLLYTWATRDGIDIERRMSDGAFLTNGELAALVGASRQEIGQRGAKVVGLTKAKQSGVAVDVGVCRETSANRLRTIADYLGWLGREGYARLAPLEADARLSLCSAMLGHLRAMSPSGKGRNTVGMREGPSSEVMDTILASIEIDAANNPWQDLGLRVRNRLLINLFFALGLRRGEALGVRIESIDFRKATLTVVRAPDDPDDPRTYQPLAKTRDRILPLKEGLARMIEDYVLRIRSKIPGVRKHSFLFVSHQTGAPLSLVAVNKVFTSLRERVVGLPENLTPHVMRHAWNDAFSALMDRKQVTEERETQMRSMMMGWSPTSGTAAVYTRRHVREEARRASLAHQLSIVDGGKP